MKGYQLRITLRELPTTWRRVVVPQGITFRTLHYVIQFAMGWHDAHLHEFWSDDDPTVYTDNSDAIEEYQYYSKQPGSPGHEYVQRILESPMQSSAEVKIDAVLQRSRHLTYVYDLGDNWEHDVVLEEAVELTEPFPVCIGAGGACPPEDVGGPYGFMDFLEAWHDPNHEEHESAVAWGRMQGFTNSFDLDRANQTLRWKLPLGGSKVEEYAREVTELVFPAAVRMAFKARIPGEALLETHKLRYFLDFLRVVKERGPLKATAKGNLPAKLVMELYQRGFNYLDAIPYDRVRKEDDAWFLRELHEQARLAGFVFRRKGQIGLTKRGVAILEAPREEAYLSLWRAFLHQYLLDYVDGYAPLHPFYIGKIMQLLHRFGSEERDSSFYSDQLAQAYPHLLEDDIERYGSEERARKGFSSSVYHRIISRCLAEFGLVEVKTIQGSEPWEETYLVRKTELMDAVIAVW